MTESPATKPANGDVCQRVKNGLKPERNGFVRSLHRCHERQPKHHCHPEEEEVRPGMGRGGEAGEAGEASTVGTRKHPDGAVIAVIFMSSCDIRMWHENSFRVLTESRCWLPDSFVVIELWFSRSLLHRVQTKLHKKYSSLKSFRSFSMLYIPLKHILKAVSESLRGTL